MARKPRRPLGRRLRRNPVARELARETYRKRVIDRKDAYRRQPKHPKPAEERDT